MMMKRYIYCLFFAFVSVLQVVAQRSSAEQVMERFRATMEECVASEMRFTLTGADARGAMVTPIHGVVYRQGGDYVMINDQVEVYACGDTKWIYTVDNNEVIIMRHDHSSVDLVENPLALFSAQLSMEYTFLGKPNLVVENGREVVEITLVPVKKNMPYSSIVLRIVCNECRDAQLCVSTVAPHTVAPHSVRYNANNGSWFEALITDFTIVKQPFPQDRFVFSVKERPGVFVTDLRF
jgi:outer membrane lipoprotein-sorting protein